MLITNVQMSNPQLQYMCHISNQVNRGHYRETGKGNLLVVFKEKSSSRIDMKILEDKRQTIAANPMRRKGNI